MCTFVSRERVMGSRGSVAALNWQANGARLAMDSPGYPVRGRLSVAGERSEGEFQGPRIPIHELLADRSGVAEEGGIGRGAVADRRVLAAVCERGQTRGGGHGFTHGHHGQTIDTRLGLI